MKEWDTWYFWLPQARSDRIQCPGVFTMFVSSLHIIVAGSEGTLAGSDTKAPSGITLIPVLLWSLFVHSPLMCFLPQPQTFFLPLNVCLFCFYLSLSLCQQSYICLLSFKKKKKKNPKRNNPKRLYIQHMQYWNSVQEDVLASFHLLLKYNTCQFSLQKFTWVKVQRL